MADIARLRALGLDPALIRLLAQREADQSVSTQQPQAAAYPPAAAPTEPGAPVAASPSMIPSFTPEERESLIGSVGRKALSGLQWVGESLDKPGRAVRGVLGGEFNEIFDIIPFSDTLGLTTPEDDVSGRDLLEKAGILSQNRPGLDLGDVAGFGVEVVTDPFSWMSLGGAKAASTVLTEGSQAAKAASTVLTEGSQAAKAASLAADASKAIVPGAVVDGVVHAGAPIAAKVASTAGAAVDDLAQWTLNGVDQFPTPKKITRIEVGPDGKQYAMFEGLNTGAPLDQLSVAAKAATAAPPVVPTAAGAAVDDLAQWTLNGVDQFPTPKKITRIEVGPDGKQYAMFEGLNTGAPLDQLSVAAKAATAAPPVVPTAATDALTASTKADEIAAGTRSLVSFHTPAFGIPLPSKIPFTDIKIPRVALPIKELGGFGTGEKAAALYRAAAYGKYSPNPYVRKLFSTSQEVRESPIKNQEHADRLWEAQVHATDAAALQGVDLLKSERIAAVAMSDLADQAFFGKKDGRLHLIADAVEQAAGASQELRGVLKRRFGSEAPDWSAIKSDPKQLNEAADIYDSIVRDQKQYGDLADDLRVRHEELLSHVFEGANAKDPLYAQWFDDNLRAFVERTDDFGMEHVITKLKDSGIKETVEGFDTAAQALYQHADSLRTLFRESIKEADRLGLKVEEFVSDLYGYSHRSADYAPGTAAGNFFKKRTIKTTGEAFQQKRGDILRDIPSHIIQQISRDERFTAVKHNVERAKAAMSRVGNFFSPEVARAPQPGTYSEHVFNAARAEGVSYAGLSSAAKEVLAEDSVRYAAMQAERKRMHAAASSIDPEWRKNVNAALKADSDYTSVPGFDEIAQLLKMDSPTAWEALKTWNKKIDRLPGEEVARQALERYKAAQAHAVDSGDDLDFFDMVNDKTAYPDPSFGDAPLKWTRENAAFQLAHEYDLPAWWNYDKIMRKSLTKSADKTLSALASDKSLSDGGFVDAWWKEMKNREALLPDGAEKWATDSSDADLFTINAKQMMPELQNITVLGQDDLTSLVNHFYHMPKEVLKNGLYNRGTTVDAVDYLLQYTRLKAGIASLRGILRGKDVLHIGKDSADSAGGVLLQDAWKSADLTDNGLLDFAKEIHGDLDPKAMADALNKTFVDKDVAETMAGYVKMFKEPETASALGKIADATNGLWKGTLTIPYPAFHTRNRISGVGANWAAGIHSAEGDEVADALFHQREITGVEGLGSAEDLLNEIKVQNVTGAGSGGGSGVAFDHTERLRGMGASNLPVGTTTTKYILSPFGDLVDDFNATRKASGLKQALKELVVGGKRPDGSTKVDLNPTGIAGAYDPIGASARGSDLDELGKPLKGIAKHTAPTTTNAIYQAGSNANNYVEWMNRVGPYIGLRKAGWTPAMAARKVKQVQFDYRDLSPIERKIFKRAIPFYSFARKNLEQQVRLLLANPGGRTAQMIRLENKAANESKGKDGYVPKYLAESFALRLPGGDERDAKFFSQSGLFPHEEAFNRFAFDDGLFPLNAKRTGEKILAQAHPLIQGPAEFISGRQFWSGRNIDDLYQTPTGDQDVNLMLSKLPTSRLLNTVGGLFDPRKNIAEKAFNLAVGGAKITDVDPVKQRALEMRDILESTLSSDPDIASYTGLYANDLKSLMDRYNAGDQEAAKMLRLYQEIAKELRALKKEGSAQPSPQ